MSNYLCVGLNVALCTLLCISTGEMPFGRGCSDDPLIDENNENCLTASEQQTIESWIEAGQAQ